MAERRPSFKRSGITMTGRQMRVVDQLEADGWLVLSADPNRWSGEERRQAAQRLIAWGGMEQVGWGGCTERSDCNDGHEWHLVHEDGTPQLDPDHPRWPVYRLTEETDGADPS